MEPSEILELFGKRATSIKPGLDRISLAHKALGWPAKSTPCIVVAGTNGKGSTCGFLFRLLAAAGLRVGLFTSPHLIEFRERITTSHADVSNEDLVRHIQYLKLRLPEELWGQLTFFEINTLLAALVFDELKTDVNVFEIGLGGRLDCVNIFDGDVSVITSIGLDHQEFLGNSLTAIAREKAGIMRSGRPIVWGGLETSDQEAHSAIVDSAKATGAYLIEPQDIDQARLPKMIQRYPSFLSWNFKVAMAAFRQLTLSGRCKNLAEDAEAIALGHFDNADLPWPVTLSGRFDRVTVRKDGITRDLLIDVCHNPHGAKALSAALTEVELASEGVRRPCIISVLSDKDASGIWAEIRGKISDVIRFKFASPRSWDEYDNRIEGPMMESFQRAWSEALSRPTWRHQEPWLIFGSVAAVGDVLSFFQEDGWQVERKIRN